MRDTKQSLNARKRKWQGRGWKKNNSCALTRSTPDNHVKHSSKKSKVENEPKSASSVMNSTVRTLFGDDAKPLMSYLFARGLVIEEKHCDKDLWRGLERCIIIVDSKFSRNDPSIDKNVSLRIFASNSYAFLIMQCCRLSLIAVTARIHTSLL